MTITEMSVADAKARLSAVLQTVEAGGEVIITRRGRPVARLSAVHAKPAPIDFSRADALRARQRPAKNASSTWLRKLRDQARY